MDNRVRGRVSVHPRGFGFLNIDTPEGEIAAFIVPPELNPFLDGDEVSAEVLPSTQDPTRFTATALALLERKRGELFGSLTLRNKRRFLRVDRLVANTDWPFEEGSAETLDEGSYVNGSDEEISLRNTLVILTTNVGAEVYRESGLGFARGDGWAAKRKTLR